MRASSSRAMRSRPRVGVDDHAVADVERLRRAPAGSSPATVRMFSRSVLAGLQRRLAADAGAARGPGAAAVRRVVGVAGDDAHALDRHAERSATICAVIASAPWPCSVTLDWQMTAPVASSRTVDAVLRGDARAADAVEGGARIGDLDEAGDADAAMDAALAQARLLAAQAPRSPSCASSLSREAWCDSASNLQARGRIGRDRRRRRSGCGAGSRPGPCRSCAPPDRRAPSVTEQAIGWPTARYWHMTFLFWKTTRARAR